MIAVLRHELRGYFHSLTAYVFGASLLAFVGLGANSARLRVPAEEHRELVFRAIDAIDRGEPGPGAQ